MAPKAAIELAASVIGLIAVFFTVYLFMDARHAKQEALLEMEREHTVNELRIREEILNRDIKKDAEAASHYRDLAHDRDLERAEASRKQYLEEQLEQKYSESRLIQKRLLELETE